jgi:serine protease AprX
VSLKAAVSDGAVDVSQVIASINWVTQHAKTGGYNIRVINLSFGTDGVQSWQLDPLSYAVEQAWRKGIVVVVAAGNDGTDKVELANPALNPHVLAVGAMDHKDTLDILDDRVADFANRGTAKRKPDLAAPGVRVKSLRTPGSFLDETFPAARVGDRLFSGSGTSQAAAVTSGAVALLLQRYPQLTPRQVKEHLNAAAVKNDMSGSFGLGNGVLDVRAAQLLPPSTITTAQAAFGSGLGTLHGARGTSRVADCDDAGVCVELTGEQDIMGSPWRATDWATKVANDKSWSDGEWNGSAWTGTGWTGASWTGDSWSGRTWSGRTWSGRTWSGRTWSGRTWSGRTWSGDGWSAGTWSGRTWSGRTWSGRTWSGEAWAGGSWS